MISRFISLLANSQHHFINLIRIAIFIVMGWIGGLKAFPYEAERVVPYVANSPLMSFFFTKDAPEYKYYKNAEGATDLENIEWHKNNGTYMFALGLGLIIVTMGIMTLLGIWFAKVGLLGGLFTFAMSLVTLSFIITTPEAYVQDLGGDFPTPHHGFPYLSSMGRVVVKDVIMMAGGLVCAADCAQRILQNGREVG